MRPKTFPLLALLLVCHPILGFPAEVRHALVIGNGAYAHTRALNNPSNDARGVSAILRKTGFQVTERVDADLKSMKAAFREFIDGLPVGEDGQTVALIYFAGHGVQIDGQNFLIPIDAEMARDFEVPDETMPLEAMIRGLDGAGVDLGILILDCCRDNPFSRSWRGGRSTTGGGLAIPKGAPRGTFISFATSPGEVAADGEGENSPFTEALLKHLATPGKGFEDVFKAVGRDVALATKGSQEPWFNSKFYGDFSFVPAGTPSGTPPSMPVAPVPPENPGGGEIQEKPKGSRLRDPSPEEVKRREKEMIAAISQHPPRVLISRMAESDPSEQLRFNACSQLVNMKNPGAQGKLHKLFEESSDPDLKSNIAKLLWWEFSDKSRADFLYQDYMNRGDKGPVINWGFWVPALVEMKHERALASFRKSFLTNYNVSSNANIRHLMILKMGLPMAAYDSSLVSTIRNRVKALPKSGTDAAIYFGLAALGDEYSIGRVTSALDEPLGQYDNPLVFSIFVSKQSFRKYEHLYGFSSLGSDKKGVVDYALDRLKEFKNPSQCLDGVFTILSQEELAGGSPSHPFASLEIDFPETLFADAALRDPRLPEEGKAVELDFNIGGPMPDEKQFDKCAPGLAVQGNAGVVSFASRWLDSPNPAMRFRAARLVSLFSESEKIEKKPDNLKELQTRAAAALVDLYESAPLQFAEAEFGDFPGKKDILYSLEALDPEACLALCSRYFEQVDGSPNLMVSETVVYDEKEKALKIQKESKSDAFYDTDGLTWETKFQAEREWLVLDVLSLYIRLTGLRDEAFLERIRSFQFQQPVASRGAKINKEVGPLGSRKIDSVAEVAARINKILFTSGELHVYPQVVQDFHSSDDDARSEALLTLVEAAEKF